MHRGPYRGFEAPPATDRRPASGWAAARLIAPQTTRPDGVSRTRPAIMSETVREPSPPRWTTDKARLIVDYIRMVDRPAYWRAMKAKQRERRKS
jgi:hypothetical protein